MLKALERHFHRLDISDEYIQRHVMDLAFMARYKYDDYEMYTPGSRFLVHLYVWLRQFSPDERKGALDFLRDNLVFVSQREMQDLSRFLYYELIVPEILQEIIRAERLGRFEHRRAYSLHFRKYLRRCLFIALSDGAKIDFFRRHHVDLSQEQVLPYYRTSIDDYLHALRRDTGDQADTFWSVFLIDDFTASGRTMVRKEGDKVVGSLQRVYGLHAPILDSAKHIYLCHYLATDAAQRHVMSHVELMDGYRGKLKCLAAQLLPESIRITPDLSTTATAMTMCSMSEKYYDASYEDANTAPGGGIKFGYSGQGLPVVLYSNTPNNSLFLLWLDSALKHSDKRFHPLFRRIDRHRPT